MSPPALYLKKKIFRVETLRTSHVGFSKRSSEREEIPHTLFETESAVYKRSLSLSLSFSLSNAPFSREKAHALWSQRESPSRLYEYIKCAEGTGDERVCGAAGRWVPGYGRERRGAVQDRVEALRLALGLFEALTTVLCALWTLEWDL